ncbi:MAG: class 3 adenylate cyclase/uncharacterized protein YggT (Ycf19 family) [Gammaproteobacteria bacterium]|jgi:class 3 adenylate cyclase/uncharacterized protein YggT (Ycf19 family)
MHAVGATLLGFLVFILGKIISLLRLCLMAYFIALCITLYGGYSQFLLLDRFVSWVNRLAGPAQNILRENLPTVVGGIDITPVLLLIISGIVWTWLDSRWQRWRMNVALWKKSARYKRQLTRIRHEARKQAKNIEALPETPEPSSREELLELYANTKKALEAQKQLLAFLSIDVVGSTRMKEHEDAAIATRDFSRYKILVDEIIVRYDYLKASWTPDGVMICFRETTQAIAAGQDVLRSLAQFNREIKAMEADFKVRVGINSGQVLYDDGVPMEEMSDRIIDIAGHMQKYADENSIFINKHAVLDDIFMSGFVPANTEVDGCEVLVWKCL